MEKSHERPFDHSCVWHPSFAGAVSPGARHDPSKSASDAPGLSQGYSSCGATKNPRRTAPDTLLGNYLVAPGARLPPGSCALRKSSTIRLLRDLPQCLWSPFSVQHGGLADSRLADLLAVHAKRCGTPWNGGHGRVQKLRHALQRISDWNDLLSGNRRCHRSSGHLCLDRSCPGARTLQLACYSPCLLRKYSAEVW